MRFLKYKISIIIVAIFSFGLTSCEGDGGAGEVIELDARFLSNVDVRTISFINVSNDAVNYSWDFGNGTSSTLAEPTVTYENGTYTVTLTAFDINGNADTFQETFVIDIPVCTDESAENLDPANGDINWTFLDANGNATFDAFGNTAGFIVDNPVIDAVNSSCKVQRYEKTIGCQTFAGLGVGLATSIDFSTTSNKTFTMKVLAETQITEVTLRLEFMPFPNTEPSQDRVANITQIGEWQELTFDFTDVPTGTFQSMIIYFERNADCDGDIYYFDEIVQQ
ncbi:PKD domain-containing protein [uncultured Psychroserpens sp.]|uniref:PKD domain-containing protein n=1 Tax=uncultured Psychroserpens sp. TaxID=255436 RepID=UPI0026322068|nr:PKD domain-containing protein [uncultured Psychroserpens sp.]